MCIQGVGIDIAEIERFKDKSDSFFRKVFTDNEIEYCLQKGEPAQHFSSRFSAKEAVIKALGLMGIFDITYKDIEIINSENKVPSCRIYKNGKITDEFNVKISMSHARGYAAAVALISENCKQE